MSQSTHKRRERYHSDPVFRAKCLSRTKAWWQRHKDYQQRWDKKWRESNAQLIAAVKSKPCADCGKVFPTYVMDFDHVRGVKVDSVARIAGRGHGTRKKLLEEIEKCDVVCSNCHRIRTHNRKKGRANT